MLVDMATISVTRASGQVYTSHHNSEWSAMPQESWRGEKTERKLTLQLSGIF